MAAPSSKTLKDLSGKWEMNRELSSDPVPVLELQGVSALVRKIVPHASISLSVTQKEANGTTQILIDQKTTANIPAVNEEWILDWEQREQKDKVIGNVKSRSRWQKKEQIEKSFLKEGLQEDEVIEAEVIGLDVDWKAEQAWGFMDIAGSRRFVRKVATSNKEGKSVETILVYDFVS